MHMSLGDGNEQTALVYIGVLVGGGVLRFLGGGGGDTAEKSKTE